LTLLHTVCGYSYTPPGYFTHLLTLVTALPFTFGCPIRPHTTHRFYGSVPVGWILLPVVRVTCCVARSTPPLRLRFTLLRVTAAPRLRLLRAFPFAVTFHFAVVPPHVLPVTLTLGLRLLRLHARYTRCGCYRIHTGCCLVYGLPRYTCILPRLRTRRCLRAFILPFTLRTGFYCAPHVRLLRLRVYAHVCGLPRLRCPPHHYRYAATTYGYRTPPHRVYIPAHTRVCYRRLPAVTPAVADTLHTHYRGSFWFGSGYRSFTAVTDAGLPVALRLVIHAGYCTRFFCTFYWFTIYARHRLVGYHTTHRFSTLCGCYRTAPHTTPLPTILRFRFYTAILRTRRFARILFTFYCGCVAGSHFGLPARLVGLLRGWLRWLPRTHAHTRLPHTLTTVCLYRFARTRSFSRLLHTACLPALQPTLLPGYCGSRCGFSSGLVAVTVTLPYVRGYTVTVGCYPYRFHTTHALLHRLYTHLLRLPVLAVTRVLHGSVLAFYALPFTRWITAPLLPHAAAFRVTFCSLHTRGYTFTVWIAVTVTLYLRSAVLPALGYHVTTHAAYAYALRCQFTVTRYARFTHPFTHTRLFPALSFPTTYCHYRCRLPAAV